MAAESIAQHGEQMANRLPFDVQYQYGADNERHNFPERNEHVSEVSRQPHFFLHSPQRSDES